MIDAGQVIGGWGLDDIEDQTGRVVLITGANSGVGLYTSIGVARAGAHVVMACRDEARSAPALQKVVEAGGSAELRQLDLADLDSVASFGTDLAKDHDKIDVLINNAGVMGGPRRDTAQGYELQMGTNHLGHFALTSRIWSLIVRGESPRVISLSSLAARQGSLNPAITAQTLTDPTPYVAFATYANTKQATLLFSQELARRTVVADVNVESIGVHPGVSASNLFNRQLEERRLGFAVPVVDTLGKVVLQSSRSGALPTIRAATDQGIPNGSFVGPRGLGQFRGAPIVIPLYRQGRDQKTAMKLWELSEDLTDTKLLANY